jgi:hypothetical protein
MMRLTQSYHTRALVPTQECKDVKPGREYGHAGGPGRLGLSGARGGRRTGGPPVCNLQTAMALKFSQMGCWGPQLHIEINWQEAVLMANCAGFRTLRQEKSREGGR